MIKKRLLSQIGHLDGFSIRPDPLQIIKQTLFLVKQVNNNIPVVHQDPVRRMIAFNALGCDAGFSELFFNIVRDRLELPDVVSSCYYEIVSNDTDIADINRLDIYALLFFNAFTCQFCQFPARPTFWLLSSISFL